MSDALCVTDPGVGMYIQWVILSLMGLSAWLVLQTGRISLGQQAYFGVGAYAAATVTVMFNGSLVLALLVAFFFGVLFAALTSWILKTLNGLQFALATLAIAELVRLGLSSWSWRMPHANGYEVGPDGVHGFREIRWLFENKMSSEFFLALCAVSLIIWLFLILMIGKTKQGVSIRAVGMDSELAAFQGEPVQSLQAMTQTLAGVLELWRVLCMHTKPPMLNPQYLMSCWGFTLWATPCWAVLQHLSDLSWVLHLI